MTDGPSVHDLLDGTDEEKNLAEDLAGVMDFLSRFLGAAEEGNWRYANDKADQLRESIEKFQRRLTDTVPDGRGDVQRDEDGRPVRRFAPPNADGKRVHQATTAYVQSYEAGRALFPIDGLEDDQVKARLLADLERTAALRAAMDAGDAEALSRLTGRQVTIVQGPDGGR
ncbi:hypothetical protein OHS33_38985 (plasmid) [Streptomyces sp. NBC_00536]|uniref:hypothetical protein n=1 Tax=Streptomyces sp. NBC_00536 TaxID=2975769 RepID=UPI002E80D90A|nr:hypothetical protein [Streptomyces sp. NBC_00536]WUC84344.1 hypothetical protein OHS33_38985 [Streptomyces sp. NBC_00536]